MAIAASVGFGRGSFGNRGLSEITKMPGAGQVLPALSCYFLGASNIPGRAALLSRLIIKLNIYYVSKKPIATSCTNGLPVLYCLQGR